MDTLNINKEYTVYIYVQYILHSYSALSTIFFSFCFEIQILANVM